MLNCKPGRERNSLNGALRGRGCGAVRCGVEGRVSATRTRQEKLVWMEDSAKISLMEFHMVMAKMSHRH